MSAAEVLAAHQWRGGILGCECGWDWPEERTYFCGEDERIAKAHIAHQLDALKAAGYAVVELPAAQPDWHGGLSLWPVEQEWQGRPDRPGEVTIRKSDERITITSVSTPFYSTVGARSLAAALLAAAQAADDGQLPMNTTDEEPQP